MDGVIAYVLSNIAPAIAQLMGFYFAGILLFFGGLIALGGIFSNRPGDRRVRATIVALRGGTETLSESKRKSPSTIYYPVYEYTDLSGQTVRAESDWGSSSLTDKKIGTQAYVRIDPANPERVKTDLGFLKVIALLFIAAGLYVIYFVLTEFPISWMTAAAFVFLLLSMGRKLGKIWIAKKDRLTPEAFRERMNATFRRERESKPLLDQGDVSRIARDHDRQRVKITPYVLLLSLLLLGGGFYAGGDSLNLIFSGIPAEGQVTGYTSHTNSDGTYYAPQVAFVDKMGTQRQFTDFVSSHSRPYEIGSAVPILYLENSESAMIKGTWQRWILPGFLWLCGALCLMTTLGGPRRI